MTYKKELKISAAILVLLAVAAAFLIAQPAHANPSTFVRAQTAVATTTLSYLTPGTGTTTLSINSAANVAFDSAVLNFCLTASSTATTVNIGREYSQDGQTWYTDGLSERATTSAAINVSVPWTYTYKYASTTPGGGAVASTTSSGCETVVVPTPTKYIRTFFSLPAGSTNGGIYAEIVAKQQAN